MLRIVLIRPGSTTFDQEGRIKGSLDIPLSETGSEQVAEVCAQLAEMKFDAVYAAPCESAKTTASVIAKRSKCKVREVDDLRNLDHGLWQGKLIDEVRRQQPKVYRQFQDNPESICPPGGETIQSATKRLGKLLPKWAKKHQDEVIAVIAPEPLASILKHCIDMNELGDLWEHECDNGTWELLVLDPRIAKSVSIRQSSSVEHSVQPA